MLYDNFIMPWLTDGFWTAFIFSLIFPALGAMTLIRLLFEKKLYLGLYPSFWVGQGICYAILQGLAAEILDGKTRQAFYTEPWFYLALAPIYLGIVALSNIVEKDAERKGRPENIRKEKSKEAQWWQTYVGLPLSICLTLLVLPPAIDLGASPEIIAAAVLTLCVWLIVFARDGAKPVPTSYAEWTKFMAPAIVLALTIPALVGIT